MTIAELQFLSLVRIFIIAQYVLTSVVDTQWLGSVQGSENSVTSLISEGGALGSRRSSTLSYADILYICSSSVVNSVEVLKSGNL